MGQTPPTSDPWHWIPPHERDVHALLHTFCRLSSGTCPAFQTLKLAWRLLDFTRVYQARGFLLDPENFTQGLFAACLDALALPLPAQATLIPANPTSSRANPTSSRANPISSRASLHTARAGQAPGPARPAAAEDGPSSSSRGRPPPADQTLKARVIDLPGQSRSGSPGASADDDDDLETLLRQSFSDQHEGGYAGGGTTGTGLPEAVLAEALGASPVQTGVSRGIHQQPGPRSPGDQHTDDRSSDPAYDQQLLAELTGSLSGAQGPAGTSLPVVLLGDRDLVSRSPDRSEGLGLEVEPDIRCAGTVDRADESEEGFPGLPFDPETLSGPNSGLLNSPQWSGCLGSPLMSRLQADADISETPVPFAAEGETHPRPSSRDSASLVPWTPDLQQATMPWPGTQDTFRSPGFPQRLMEDSGGKGVPRAGASRFSLPSLESPIAVAEYHLEDLFGDEERDGDAAVLCSPLLNQALGRDNGAIPGGALHAGVEERVPGNPVSGDPEHLQGTGHGVDPAQSGSPNRDSEHRSGLVHGLVGGQGQDASGLEDECGGTARDHGTGRDAEELWAESPSAEREPSFVQQVGAVYALYALYRTQRGPRYSRIYLALRALNLLTALAQQARTAGVEDVREAVRWLVSQNAFVVGASTRPPSWAPPATPRDFASFFRVERERVRRRRGVSVDASYAEGLIRGVIGHLRETPLGLASLPHQQLLHQSYQRKLQLVWKGLRVPPPQGVVDPNLGKKLAKKLEAMERVASEVPGQGRRKSQRQQHAAREDGLDSGSETEPEAEPEVEAEAAGEAGHADAGGEGEEAEEDWGALEEAWDAASAGDESEVDDDLGSALKGAKGLPKGAAAVLQKVMRDEKLQQKRLANWVSTFDAGLRGMHATSSDRTGCAVRDLPTGVPSHRPSSPSEQTSPMSAQEIPVPTQRLSRAPSPQPPGPQPQQVPMGIQRSDAPSASLPRENGAMLSGGRQVRTEPVPPTAGQATLISLARVESRAPSAHDKAAANRAGLRRPRVPKNKNAGTVAETIEPGQTTTCIGPPGTGQCTVASAAGQALTAQSAPITAGQAITARPASSSALQAPTIQPTRQATTAQPARRATTAQPAPLLAPQATASQPARQAETAQSASSSARHAAQPAQPTRQATTAQPARQAKTAQPAFSSAFHAAQPAQPARQAITGPAAAALDCEGATAQPARQGVTGPNASGTGQQARKKRRPPARAGARTVKRLKQAHVKSLTRTTSLGPSHVGTGSRAPSSGPAHRDLAPDLPAAACTAVALEDRSATTPREAVLPAPTCTAPQMQGGGPPRQPGPVSGTLVPPVGLISVRSLDARIKRAVAKHAMGTQSAKRPRPAPSPAETAPSVLQPPPSVPQPRLTGSSSRLCPELPSEGLLPRPAPRQVHEKVHVVHPRGAPNRALPGNEPAALISGSRIGTARMPRSHVKPTPAVLSQTPATSAAAPSGATPCLPKPLVQATQGAPDFLAVGPSAGASARPSVLGSSRLSAEAGGPLGGPTGGGTPLPDQQGEVLDRCALMKKMDDFLSGVGSFLS